MLETQCYYRQPKAASILLLLCCQVFLSQMVFSRQTELNFINFSSKDGMSSNTVTAILKDKYGYMWFGTDDGLNKFDGTNFTVYRHKSSDTNSISANSILAIHEDRLGNLWIGTSNALCLYNRKKDCFINYHITSNYTVRTISGDHLGNLWIGSYAGLYKFHPETGKTTSYVANIVNCVFEDSRHRLWIGGNAGLYLYQRSTDNFKHFVHDPANPLSIPDNSVMAIAEDYHGNLWIGTNDGGLSMLQPDGKGFSNYTHNKTDNQTLSSNRIFAITPEHTDKLWIGTENGLNIFDLHGKTSLRIMNEPGNRYNLHGKSIRSIFIDNGIYWIGTYQGGVNKYDKNLAFFNLRQSNPFDPAGLSAPVITSFSEAGNGDIYVGTDGGGINLYHRKTGLFDHPVFNNEGKNKQPAVLALERAEEELWIGTYMKGIYVLNTLNGKVKHYVKGNGPKSLSGNDIFCLKKDSRGNIWIGTNGNGINVYNPVTEKFRRFNKDAIYPHITKVLTNGFIRAIEEDRSGNIWIAAIGAGIIVYNPFLNKLRLFNHRNSNLPAEDVQAIHVGKSGRIWAGTHDGGLCMFDSTLKKFDCYSEQQGLSNAVIYKILEDDTRKVWVSTNKGISSFDPCTMKFRNYFYYNGLQRSTFCPGAGLKTSSGELFFGGLDGFNYFHPGKLNANESVPGIALTGLRIANSLVIPDGNIAIKEDVSVADEIRLNHGQNCSIEFATLNYTAPQESRYAYMLEGFDKAWNEVGTSRIATYSSLPPGKYVFRVKASSEDGSWHTKETTINIYVKPPFWLTIYAFLIYILTAAFILWALRHRYIRKLERREIERMHELERLKIKYLTNLSHEFRTPVSLIIGPVDNLIRQEISEEKLGQLNLVKRNARRLLNLVNQLLDFRKIEEKELQLNLTKGEIISFIKEVVESFKDISERRHISFSVNSTPNTFYTCFDKDKIERILFNLLSNAFKFTPKGGKISLNIIPDPGVGLNIIIADTGVGMPPEVQEKIFTRFFQADANPAILNQGSGIGLSITLEFVKMHGGTINVESIAGKGSIFTVQLPLKEIPAPLPITEQSEIINIPEQPPALLGNESLTVLLIEDNDDFRNYLKDNLKFFYKIVEASDGNEGWKKALSKHPHVIVSDINMPYMDGIQLSRKIKSDKRTSHIPIILLTALTGEASILKGLETGASDYLTKPFNFDVLNIKIRNLLLLNQRLKDTYTGQLKVIMPAADVESENENFLLKVTQYIEENINSDKLTVEELSKHLFMSRASLYTKILQLTGETPVEFIRSIKLNKAADLLENSDMKIAQIGYAVGFTTPNYFARAFKAKFNLLPSAYQVLKRRSSN